MRTAVYYWEKGSPVYHDMDRDHGYVVICGNDEGYFSDAAAAVRYAEFMASLGYDALYFDAQIDCSGILRRFKRMSEQEVSACIALGI